MEPIFVISGILAAISIGSIGVTLLMIALGKIKS
jgi:hypothetical protein